MAHNPGVRSRFPTVILFEDYNPDELMAIAEGILKKQHLTATEGGLKALRTKLQTMVDAPDVQVMFVVDASFRWALKSFF